MRAGEARQRAGRRQPRPSQTEPARSRSRRRPRRAVGTHRVAARRRGRAVLRSAPGAASVPERPQPAPAGGEERRRGRVSRQVPSTRPGPSGYGGPARPGPAPVPAPGSGAGQVSASFCSRFRAWFRPARADARPDARSSTRCAAARSSPGQQPLQLDVHRHGLGATRSTARSWWPAWRRRCQHRGAPGQGTGRPGSARSAAGRGRAVRARWAGQDRAVLATPAVPADHGPAGRGQARAACRPGRSPRRGGPGGGGGTGGPGAGTRPGGGRGGPGGAGRGGPGGGGGGGGAPRPGGAPARPGGGGRGRSGTQGAFGRPGGRPSRGRKSKKQRRQEFDNMQAPSIGGVSVPRGNGQIDQAVARRVAERLRRQDRREPGVARPGAFPPRRDGDRDPVGQRRDAAAARRRAELQRPGRLA